MQSLSSFRNPPCNKTMGIELECFQQPYRENTAIRGKFHGFFYATNDGSLVEPIGRWSSYCYSTEFVSQPLTPEWLKKSLFKLGSKFDWITHESCGIHIHVSRKWMNKARAQAIHKFYCALRAADQKHFFGRVANAYCREQPFGMTRYNAVNSENSATFELRMFASGDWQWACYCVDMAVYLLNNAKHLNISACYAEADRLRRVHSICG